MGSHKLLEQPTEWGEHMISFNSFPATSQKHVKQVFYICFISLNPTENEFIFDWKLSHNYNIYETIYNCLIIKFHETIIKSYNSQPI